MFSRLGYRLQKFMYGRYGSDELSRFLSIVSLVLIVVTMINPIGILDLILTGLSYAMMFLAFFRMLSRNTYKRYQENRKYLMLLQRLKDRQHRYYDCPRCKQQVRVPRGKGKISIACPKCGEKFIRKT